MRQADMALYQAKKEEGSSYHFFHRGMDEQLRQRIELEREIGPAIEAGQIIPYYQPLVDLKSSAVMVVRFSPDGNTRGADCCRRQSSFP